MLNITGKVQIFPHQINIFLHDDICGLKMLAFRDYCNTHPDEFKLYADSKTQIATHAGTGCCGLDFSGIVPCICACVGKKHLAYKVNKGQTMQPQMLRALQWYQNNQHPDILLPNKTGSRETICADR